jgi:hypothetical protein
MNRSHHTNSETKRRLSRGQVHLGPVVWIAILLASWLVIVDWHVLPDLVSATMAALP